jgi:hypothetical protein
MRRDHLLEQTELKRSLYGQLSSESARLMRSSPMSGTIVLSFPLIL